MKFWKKCILWLIVHLCGVAVGFITTSTHNEIATVICIVIGFASGFLFSILVDVFLKKEKAE